MNRPAARLLATTLAAVLLCLAFPGASPASASGWRWPVHGSVITPYRNGADPYAGGQHRGIDIAAPAGTPVGSASGGVVTFAGTAGSSGRTVTVRTADGRFDASYLHLASIAVVRGERVPAGARLGTVGTSGRRSAAQPHLHLGVRAAGQRHAYRDPLSLLPPPRSTRPGPEAPRAVPVRAPRPVAPGRVPARTPRPLPVPSRAPRPAPAGERGLAPAPHPAFATAARGLAPALDPALTSARSLIPSADESRRVARHHGLRLAPGAGPSPSSAAATSPRPQVRTRPALAPPATGLDLGWLAACAGLVAAAALLGTPRGPLASARRARLLAAAWGRPLRDRA